MKTTIPLFLLFLPILLFSQNKTGISYQDALDNYKHIVEENQRISPDHFIYTGPEIMVGARIPEFTGATFDGTKISSEYFKGKITILNFWQISCPPCIAEIPGFNAVIAKYGHDKFNYLAIGPDSERDIKSFLKHNPWGFSQLTDGMVAVFDIFQNKWGYPTTFVINEDGIIIAAFSGGKTDERAVTDLEEKLTAIITTALK